MQTRLILHIGLMKTGTSSLQTTLSRNREILKTHGVLYPSTTFRFNRHCDLAWSCYSRNELNKWAKSKHCSVPTEEILDMIEQEKNEHNCHTIIISAEEFSLNEPDLYIKIFEKYQSNLEAVIYIRKQDEMLQSLYKQYLKGKGITDSFQDFVKSSINYDSNLNNIINYNKLLNKWAKHIGEDNIKVGLYHNNAKKDIVKNFLELINLNQIYFSLTNLNIKENISSFDGPYLEFLRQVNEYLPAKIRSDFLQNLQWLYDQTKFNEKDRLNIKYKEYNKLIMQNFESINEQVRKKWFPEQKQLFYDIDMN